ncbi:MAG: ribose 5-phosphate isomerase B [Bacteroidetes bacterium]|nr:MAG: ribose 5-phosphate isomerase B [Bacteroidota bacterium]
MLCPNTSPHAGFEYKEKIKALLQNKGWELKDNGTDSSDSCDYPDYAHQVANDVENNNSDFGVLICGSGNGVAMAANKHSNIRAALCWNKELASLARQHNNANVICVPARFVEFGEANEIIEAFFSTDFEGGRHEERVDKIDNC